MDKHTVFQGILERGMVGIVRAGSPDIALQIAEACIAGGVTALEVAFTTPDTLGVLRALHLIVRQHQHQRGAQGDIAQQRDDFDLQRGIHDALPR